MAKFFENAKVLFLSQGEDEAFDLISRCRFIDNHLPEFLKVPRDPDQRGFIGFPDSGGEIKALASTEKAGRSTDASLVINDEWEYHPYAEINYGAVKPTVDAGGQLIGIFTGDPLKTADKSFPKGLYNAAKAGDNGFTPVFLGALERPGRDEVWLAKVSKDMAGWQRKGEYPLTEEEALSTLRSRKFFDTDILQSMYADCREPLKHELVDKYKGLVRIYRLPIVGRLYCGFTDPSDGKEDPHASVFIDVVTGEEVAESHGKVSADICAQIHDDLVRLYNNAFNSYELNARCGGIFSEKMKGLDTPNQAPFVKPDGKVDKNKKGWWTGDTLKNKMIWGLEEDIRMGRFISHSKELIYELIEFIQPEGAEPQAPRGGHNDYVMACGGLSQLRKYVHATETFAPISFKYQQPWR